MVTAHSYRLPWPPRWIALIGQEGQTVAVVEPMLPSQRGFSFPAAGPAIITHARVTMDDGMVTEMPFTYGKATVRGDEGLMVHFP